ncbi:MAG: hypothetical protein AAGF27_05065 [Pseudomonadota bacterium]
MKRTTHLPRLAMAKRTFEDALRIAAEKGSKADGAFGVRFGYMLNSHRVFTKRQDAFARGS